MSEAVRYESGASSERDIRDHLLACDGSFVPALSARVDIVEYARKLATRAVTIEAWRDDRLVGLVAAYVSVPDNSCFVSNVSVLPEFAGKGIARRLLGNLLRHDACAGAETIRLEVSARNEAAIRLYTGFGFRVSKQDGDDVFMHRPRIVKPGPNKGEA